MECSSSRHILHSFLHAHEISRRCSLPCLLGTYLRHSPSTSSSESFESFATQQLLAPQDPCSVSSQYSTSQVLHEHFTRKIRSHRRTHADEPVTLHTRVQHRTEARRGEIVSLVLARAATTVERLDETILVIARGAETGVGDVDGAAAGFAETSGVTDVDADSAVGRARGV